MHGTEHRGAWIIRKFIGPVILGRILKQRRMKAGIKVPDTPLLMVWKISLSLPPWRKVPVLRAGARSLPAAPAP